MDTPNAFIGKPERPSNEELTAALGPSAALWSELVAEVTADTPSLTQEWKGVCSQKYGWSLRLKQKSRNILYLSPCRNSFRVAFVLGDKAVKAAGEAHLPKTVAHALATAPHYPEGTGLRLTVNRPGDLAAIRELARIKLAN